MSDEENQYIITVNPTPKNAWGTDDSGKHHRVHKVFALLPQMSFPGRLPAKRVNSW
jgi:hypothetical protein